MQRELVHHQRPVVAEECFGHSDDDNSADRSSEAWVMRKCDSCLDFDADLMQHVVQVPLKFKQTSTFNR